MVRGVTGSGLQALGGVLIGSSGVVRGVTGSGL